jgi:hypothetical protein
MERFSRLGRGAQLMLVGSVLLLIVSFFRWQEIDVDLGPLGEASGGVSAWDDIGGILMGVLTIVLLARLVAQLAAVDVPIPVSFAMSSAVLAFLILVLAVIKNLTDDYSTFWSYLGVAFAVLIAVGAWMEIQAAGGVDSLRSEATTLGSGRGSRETITSPAPPAATSSPSEPSTPPPPPPPSEPAASPPPPVAEPEAPADADEPPRSTT